MKKIQLILQILGCIGALKAQSIPDKEFDWFNTSYCSIGEECKVIYLKAENDPIILNYDALQFFNLYSNIIEKMNLSMSHSVVLKLKIFFLVDGLTCINEIGAKDLGLNDFQNAQLNAALSSLKVEFGMQRNIPISTQGILYLVVKDGKLYNARNVNFGFR